MKKIIFFCGFICLLLLVYNKNMHLKNINSTDLRNISCDGIYLLDDFEDTNNYTKSNKFSEKENIIYYEECYIKIDKKNKITMMHANFNDVNVSINFHSNFKIVDDVMKILGTDFVLSWYDREQQLKQIAYIDHENYIKATFIYNTYKNELVWVITEKFY